MKLAKPFRKWWPGTELNRRRQPFQGCALPPELPGHFVFHCFFAGRPGNDGRYLRCRLAGDCDKCAVESQQARGTIAL